MSLEFWMSLTAIVLALLSLGFQALSTWRERVCLKVEQDKDHEAYSFPLMYIDRYDILFFRLSISNKAKSDVSIAKIVLRGKDGRSYLPEEYDLPDNHNKSGISFIMQDDSNHYLWFNLRSENILDQLRIPAYGHVSGFVVFLNGPIVASASETFKVEVLTSTKVYTTMVTVEKLPENLIPSHALLPPG